MVVKLNSCLTFNKISRPSSIPIPLCEDNEVLFALSKDDLKINATVVADLGPLNLRLSGVVDNQNREFKYSQEFKPSPRTP